MRRVAFQVHLEVDVPDDAPDPHLRLLPGELDVRAEAVDPLSGVSARFTFAEWAPAATRCDEDAAVDAAVALLPEAELDAVVAAVRQVQTHVPQKVRGCWVERVFDQRSHSHRFAVFDGGLPGRVESAEAAALRLLRMEQRAKLRGR